MKKQKQTKETILQYIFDNGIDKTCIWLNITPEKLDKLINPVLYSNPKNRLIKNTEVIIKAGVAEIIANNYTKLWSKYVKNISNLNMCQTSEDIFHNTLLKVMEDLSGIEEKQVLDYIDYKLKMMKFEVTQRQKELYKHQTYLEDANTESTEENNY